MTLLLCLIFGSKVSSIFLIVISPNIFAKSIPLSYFSWKSICSRSYVTHDTVNCGFVSTFVLQLVELAYKCSAVSHGNSSMCLVLARGFG